MKKQLLFLLMLMPLMASANDPVEINGIWYNLITKARVAEVTKGTTKYTGDVVIPETIKYEDITYSVTSIEDEVFESCSGLTSITIPNSVTSIGNYAFQNCSGLTSVTIPNGVTSIGAYAFRDCSNLTSVTISNSVTSIGSNAFAGCYKLKSIRISDITMWCNIVFIDEKSNPLIFAHHLFLNGTEIKDLVIPNSVTSIGSYSFYGCSGLTSITIPNSVTSIKWNAFYDCSGLTSVTIPNSMTSIGSSAFSDCI